MRLVSRGWSRSVGATGMLAAALVFSCGDHRRHTVDTSSQSIAIAPSRARESNDDPRYRAALAGMRKRLDRAGIRGGFHMVIEPPFVVAGDEEPRVLEQRASSVVRWAVERLRVAYFPRDPDPGLEIWLFRDPDSYRRHARLLFGDEPTTPYGYFDSSHNALIMDISTGGGTLVHEIVHPYVEADFDDAAPAWLNEGLGSLFEQSGERAGHIVGYPNWRLPALQRALQKRAVPTFRELTSMSDHAFYGEDRGTNYAQARYLMYYLQETGRLRSFYRAFRAAKADDPTGYATLVAALGVSDMASFEREWSELVLGLRFER
jgi:hypothetical protein